jgi:cation:H+ antiporter
MLLNLLLLIGGTALVIIGANLLVDGASSLALKLKVTPLIIGLTVVAFGTSAPELTVSLISAFQGSTDIAVGNVVGSNIFNVLVILGIAALIQPIKVASSTVWKEIPLSLLGALVVFVCMNDIWLDGGSANALTRTDGILMLFFFVVFLYYTFFQAKVGQAPSEDSEVKEMGLPKSILWIAGGLVGLVAGGSWMVDGASALALAMGVPQSIVGLTIVAAGTSMPELATSVVAAYKKNSDIAMGNVVGSNIFNSFYILGTTAVISPLPQGNITQVDFYVHILSAFLLFLTAYVGRGHKVTRLEGGILLSVYVAYLFYLLR